MNSEVSPSYLKDPNGGLLNSNLNIFECFVYLIKVKQKKKIDLKK